MQSSVGTAPSLWSEERERKKRLPLGPYTSYAIYLRKMKERGVFTTTRIHFEDDEVYEMQDDDSSITILDCDKLIGMALLGRHHPELLKSFPKWNVYGGYDPMLVFQELVSCIDTCLDDLLLGYFSDYLLDRTDMLRQLLICLLKNAKCLTCLDELIEGLGLASLVDEEMILLVVSRRNHLN